jgi:hypothetical protein
MFRIRVRLNMRISVRIWVTFKLNQSQSQSQNQGQNFGNIPTSSNIPAPYEHPCVLQTVMYHLIIPAPLKHPSTLETPVLALNIPGPCMIDYSCIFQRSMYIRTILTRPINILAPFNNPLNDDLKP